MVAQPGEAPIPLVKKLGGFVLAILGCLLTAEGILLGSTGLTALGVLLLAAGVILLLLKIVRRTGRAGNGLDA